ncbi:hypothetical protein B5K11_22600 [Rhizobium leguminosarum bv. trifolii]|uniref:hypothetical protein n=1 Tax=Rhizobium leguminosarum TaxID=384 RepID=UPI000E2F74B8|nr:hypothetical protein [Rhizobium leguminosarum]RFB88305.1 hypothetical protein B5K11_22600 [Rhizobium leguminosarum bv. trifolii]
MAGDDIKERNFFPQPPFICLALGSIETDDTSQATSLEAGGKCCTAKIIATRSSARFFGMTH